MNKPNGWYGFTAFCDLFESGQSNMTAPSKQLYCKRKDRHGKDRPDTNPLKCNWNVCPRLKGKSNVEINSIIKEESNFKSLYKRRKLKANNA